MSTNGESVRFLHTSDWQLGMTRHFLDEESQGRFTQARFDAVRAMADIAEERACAFVVVAGDIFETNQVTRRTVSRALEALARFRVPVYLLPGNHDCLTAGSVYHSRPFKEGLPANVCVLGDGEPRTPLAGVEVIGAPWTTKRPLADLAGDACQAGDPTGALRIVVAHGAVDAVAGGWQGDPSIVRLAGLERAIRQGKVGYVALGDRHSTTRVGETGRVWYSGAPEPTAYREVDSGRALVVELGEDRIAVDPVDVGRWRFLLLREELNSDADIARLAEQLRVLDDPARTIVKLEATGTLTLRQLAELEALLDRHADVLAALERPDHRQGLVVRPDDGDFSALGLTGYIAAARDRLQERSRTVGPGAAVASDALALLLRLARAGS